MKKDVEILVSGSWMKCIGSVRNGKQFISLEIYPLITSEKKIK